MSKLSRKQFLKKTMFSAAALPFLSFSQEGGLQELQIPDSDSVETDEDFWRSVRAQFTLDEKVINFNNGSVGLQPVEVQNAHLEFYRTANGASAYHMWKKQNKKREELRAALAGMMDAETEEVAINRNTTEGLSTVIFGLNLKEGDEVVVSDFDYPFMLNAWQQRQLRDGVVVNRVKLPLPIENVNQAVDLYRNAISPKTKVLHLTHVINWTGQIMPVKEITAMAKKQGCDVVVDAAHALAHVPLSFKEIGCDYMATSLHKWLGAPFGTGALVIKHEKKAALWPLMSPYEPQSDDIRKFEFLGTRSIPAEMAVLDAIAFHQKLGSENIGKRLHYIKNYWVKQVQDTERITVHTSLRPEFSGAMATFSISGLTSGEIASALWDEGGFDAGHIVWNGLDAVRISPHIYTSLEELDKMVAIIRKLAA